MFNAYFVTEWQFSALGLGILKPSSNERPR